MISGLSTLWRMALGVVSTVLVAVLSAALLWAGLSVVGSTGWPIGAWFVLAPVLYFLWLLGFLALSAIEFQIYGLLRPKPRRLTIADGRLTLGAIVLVQTYQRYDHVYALPFATALLRLPLFQKLFLLSYAPRALVGRDVLIYGRIYDPELTTLGDRAIVGGGSALAAHAMVNQGDRGISYVSAPIRVGADATIGGETRIGLGVTIGAMSVIEPGSVVVPFTTVPPGEIWGGSPARYRRSTREDDAEAALARVAATDAALARVAAARPASGSPTAAPSPGADTAVRADPAPQPDAARRLIADALNVPLETVSASATSRDLPGWDSLGKLVIATLANERYGATIAPDDVFGLRTVADVQRLISGAAPPTADGADAGRRPDSRRAVRVPDDPELLPLLDRHEVTGALADRTPEPQQRPASVVIAATFTAQPLVPSLRLWARAFGIDADVGVAPFDQLETSLLSPSGPMRAAPPDAIRVVLARGEELANDAQGRISRAQGILDAIERFATDHGSLIVGTLPPPLTSLAEADRSELETLRSEWRRRLEQIPGVEMLDVAGVVERLGTIAAGSAANEASARMPWSSAACRDLGIEIARSVRRRFVPPRKVLAVDCDGTLWRGVVGEDGVEGLGVGPEGSDRAFQLLQQRLRELKERGVLLALVSRNEEADVWRVFDEHPGMVLRRDDIAAWRIGWQPKSELLADLVAELGLSLDAVVFLDDDRAVRLEVAANAPGVVVLPLPDDPAERPAALAALWAFDGAAPTAVDQARTRMVQEEREREQIQRSTTDMGSYLRDLGLVVEIHAATDAELPRVAQLTQRTNQFNVSMRRRALDEIRVLRREATVLSLSAHDRHGEYGLVGVAIVAPDGRGSADLDTLLLSCRALGRGIEDALLHAATEAARATGAATLHAPLVVGPRNGPALAFLREHGFVETGDATLARSLDQPVVLPSHITLDGSAPVTEGRSSA